MNKYLKSIAVVTILFLAVVTSTKAQNTPINTPAPTSKFSDIAEVSFNNLYGPFTNTNGSFDVQLENICGYKLSKHFTIGLGIGLESRDSLLYLPVSVNLRWYITQKKITPFLNPYLGYSIGLSRYAGNGSIAGLDAGVNIKMRNHFNLQLSVGIRYEEVIYPLDYEPSFDEVTDVNNFLYIPFTIGLAF